MIKYLASGRLPGASHEVQQKRRGRRVTVTNGLPDKKKCTARAT